MARAARAQSPAHSAARTCHSCARSSKSSGWPSAKNSSDRGSRLHDSACAVASANGLALRASSFRACKSVGKSAAAASASAREKRRQPSSKASASTGRSGLAIRDSIAVRGCSISTAHWLIGPAWASGSERARNLARPASPAVSARRARRSISAGVSSPCARSQSNAGSHAAGKLLPVRYVAVTWSASPSVRPTATRAASQLQRAATLSSTSSRYAARYGSQALRCASVMSQLRRSERATGALPCSARNASIAGAADGSSRRSCRRAACRYGYSG